MPVWPSTPTGGGGGIDATAATSIANGVVDTRAPDVNRGQLAPPGPFPAATKNEYFEITADGTINGVAVLTGEQYRANQDTAGGNGAHWSKRIVGGTDNDAVNALIDARSTWTTITANHTTADGEWLLFANPPAGITVTLPTTPADGDRIRIGGVGFDTNSVDVASGAATIAGAASPLTIDTLHADLELVYRDAATDWELVTSGSSIEADEIHVGTSFPADTTLITILHDQVDPSANGVWHHNGSAWQQDASLGETA